jgi:cytochrome c biogenesis protein CcdA
MPDHSAQRKRRTTIIRIMLLMGFAFIFGLVGILISMPTDQRTDMPLFTISAAMILIPLLGAVVGIILGVRALLRRKTG